jgi:hypothetical protein
MAGSRGRRHASLEAQRRASWPWSLALAGGALRGVLGVLRRRRSETASRAARTRHNAGPPDRGRLAKRPRDGIPASPEARRAGVRNPAGGGVRYIRAPLPLERPDSLRHFKRRHISSSTSPEGGVPVASSSLRRDQLLLERPRLHIGRERRSRERRGVKRAGVCATFVPQRFVRRALSVAAQRAPLSGTAWPSRRCNEWCPVVTVVIPIQISPRAPHSTRACKQLRARVSNLFEDTSESGSGTGHLLNHQHNDHPRGRRWSLLLDGHSNSTDRAS